jgi:hypothetical protein
MIAPKHELAAAVIGAGLLALGFACRSFGDFYALVGLWAFCWAFRLYYLARRDWSL